jgi:hypothetical protein
VNGNWPIIIGSEAATYFCIEGLSLRLSQRFDAFGGV